MYFTLLIFLLGPGGGFSYFWLTLAVVCGGLIAGIVFTTRNGRIPPKWITIPVEILVGAGFLLFIIIEALIVHGGNQEPPAEADYLIVLGAKVNGSRPSLMLQYRIQAAAYYLKNNPETIVIASGGKGSDEDISEAECICRELVSMGIAPERILPEDRSVNTAENLRLSKKIIDNYEISGNTTNISGTNDTGGDVSVVITTTDFHLFRALRLAKQEGYENVYGNAAKSVWWLIPTNYTREFFAVVKNVILDRIL